MPQMGHSVPGLCAGVPAMPALNPIHSDSRGAFDYEPNAFGDSPYGSPRSSYLDENVEPSTFSSSPYPSWYYDASVVGLSAVAVGAMLTSGHHNAQGMNK